MRKFIKILFWTFSVVTISVVTVGALTYWRISTEWKEFYTEKEIQSIANEISAAKELNESFYAICDKLNNNDRHKSILSIKSRGIINYYFFDKLTPGTSWHISAATHFRKNGFHGSAFKLGLGLENYVTSEKCFDFVMMKGYELIKDFGYDFGGDSGSC
jgi:hypothetical protein